MVMDEPLDFEQEEEDSLLAAQRPAKRKKVIGLDDLLIDYFETGKDDLKAKSKRQRGSRGCNYSDDLDDLLGANSENETKICRIVQSVEDEAKKMDAREDVPLWGLKIFGCQKLPSTLTDTGVENSRLLQSISSDELFGFDQEIDKGEGFLERLLMNGWLLKLVHTSGSVENSVASWTLTKLLYSSNKKLLISATEFWESLLSVNEGDKLPVLLSYFPSYSAIKCAILSYGYLFDTPGTKPSTSGGDTAAPDSLTDGLPGNIIAWLRLISACCKVRKLCSIFSRSEAEQLLVVVISLFLDRELGLLHILRECLDSLVLYFTESEWESSCVMAAESIAQRVSMDLNCLRIVYCITETNDRNQFLRSQLALQLLKIGFGLKVANVEKILKLVTSINVKEKDCDLFKLYVYLVLMDTLLFSIDAFRDKAMVVESWLNYLRNCSTQLNAQSGDSMLHRSEIRLRIFFYV